MRAELFADSRDEWKWSVALRHALNAAQSLYWVTMFRSDAGEHGDDFQPVPGAMPQVTAFFQAEREKIEEGQPRSLCRTVLLGDRLKIRFDCEMTPYRGALRLRAGYFERVVTFLNARQEERRDVVLLDPDNGIGVQNNGRQIHEDHLLLVWNALREGDTLALVQFNHHVDNWVAHLQQRITDLLTPRSIRLMLMRGTTSVFIL